MKVKIKFWDAGNKKWLFGCGLDSEGKIKEFKTGEILFNVWPLRFTEVKDSKGNEIWEGDILTWGTKAVSYLIVKYDSQMARFMCHGHVMTGAFGKNFRVGLTKNKHKSEVIGNIFENPNLIIK
jgi:hypothetical protein